MRDEPSSEDPQPTGDGDILAVDDNPANLLAIEAALGSFEGRVVRANSGREALRLLLERECAVVLLDVKMPTMDGFETARMIRARKRSRHTPIIFITAHDRDDSEVLAAYELGAVDFLAKPIVPDVLRAKVAVFVELQRRTAEVARQAELIRSHERREHERALAQERSNWEAEALRRQMDQLAEADRRKDQFLAMLSHELRNPMAPLVTGLELLRDLFAGSDHVDPRVLRTHQIMTRQVQHLTRLVDDLLDMSRISSGKIELRRAPVTVQDVLDQALATSQPLIDAQQHTVQCDLPSEPRQLEGDADRLVQVLANLLNNAARYTPKRGRIALRAAAVGDEVEIRVSDNGRGISAAFLSQVFDTFAQEQNDGGAGLGLGLTVVKRIVALHGGCVHAFSAGRDRGSEFVVHLPLRGAKPAVPPEALLQPGEAKPARRSRALSIVLVEDSDDIRDLMADLLRDWGHAVSVASDGASGADLVEAEHPDVAFIDIGLPMLDGYEVAARVRAVSGSRRPRLIAMTGYGQESDKKRAREAGFDAHIVKPASIEALKSALEFEGD
jgi:two-component system, sensor histidine kinase